MILPAGHEPPAVLLQPPDDDAGPAAVAAVRIVNVSMTAQPVRLQRLPGGAQPSTSACSSALRSGAQGAGLVEYTPAEYLLMKPPFAPTSPNEPGVARGPAARSRRWRASSSCCPRRRRTAARRSPSARAGRRRPGPARRRC